MVHPAGCLLSSRLCLPYYHITYYHILLYTTIFEVHSWFRHELVYRPIVHDWTLYRVVYSVRCTGVERTVRDSVWKFFTDFCAAEKLIPKSQTDSTVCIMINIDIIQLSVDLVQWRPNFFLAPLNRLETFPNVWEYVTFVTPGRNIIDILKHHW